MMLAAYAKLDLKYEFVYFSSWGELKPKMPGGTLPVLRLPSGELFPKEGGTETKDILVHLAKQSEGKIAVDGQDALFEVADKTLNRANPFLNRWPAEKFEGEEGTEFIALARTEMGKLESGLATAFLSGETIGWVDFSLWHIIDNLRTLNPGVTEECPKLCTWYDKVRGLDGVAEYLAQRPKGGPFKTSSYGMPHSIMARDAK